MDQLKHFASQTSKLDIESLGSSPYPAAITSALCIISAGKGIQSLPGWPAYFPSLLAGGVFAGASWVISKDSEHGSSIATAWGLAYSSLFLKKSIVSRRPGPILLNLWVLGSTSFYAKEMYESFFS